MGPFYISIWWPNTCISYQCMTIQILCSCSLACLISMYFSCFKISYEVDRLTKDFEKSWELIQIQTHTRGNNKGISLQEFNLLAAFHVVCQENVPLFSREHPVGVYVYVLLCWWNQPEHFLSVQDVVPHRGATKINVEICVTSLHAHQTIPVKYLKHVNTIHLT